MEGGTFFQAQEGRIRAGLIKIRAGLTKVQASLTYLPSQQDESSQFPISSVLGFKVIQPTMMEGDT